MKVAYPARITWNPTDNVHEVIFPDLEGCITFGETREEALEMASDALSGYLKSIIARGLDIPQSSSDPSADMIAPMPSVAFAIWLRNLRKASGMTLTEVAEKLGVKYQVYQRLENPETSNPTLKTIKRIEKVFGQAALNV